MTRLAELRRTLDLVRQFSYIPVSMRDEILKMEHELIELESDDEKTN